MRCSLSRKHPRHISLTASSICLSVACPAACPAACPSCSFQYQISLSIPETAQALMVAQLVAQAVEQVLRNELEKVEVEPSGFVNSSAIFRLASRSWKPRFSGYKSTIRSCGRRTRTAMLTSSFRPTFSEPSVALPLHNFGGIRGARSRCCQVLIVRAAWEALRLEEQSKSGQEFWLEQLLATGSASGRKSLITSSPAVSQLVSPAHSSAYQLAIPVNNVFGTTSRIASRTTVGTAVGTLAEHSERQKDMRDIVNKQRLSFSCTT